MDSTPSVAGVAGVALRSSGVLLGFSRLLAALEDFERFLFLGFFKARKKDRVLRDLCMGASLVFKNGSRNGFIILINSSRVLL